MDPSGMNAITGATAEVTGWSGNVDGAPVDARDLECCFALFLGRKPSREHMEANGRSTLPLLLRSLFEGEEFQGGVLRAVLLREPLPHTALEENPPLHLIDWAQRKLPLATVSRTALGAVRTWTQLLEVLLSDRSLLSLSSELANADLDVPLRARVEADGLLKTKRAVIGSVDAASAFEVRGWAVDLCDKATPVVLEFYADHLFLGCVPCETFRPDVQDVVGGSGNFGFSYRISTAHRAGFAGGRTLIAIDSVSRERIGAPAVVRSDAALEWDLIGEMRRELSGVRQVIQRLEARLPEIGRKASVPLEAYGEYWERFYRLPSDLLDDQRRWSREFKYRPLISIVMPTWQSNTRLLRRAIDSVLAQTYGNWELILSDDASGQDELSSLASRYAGDSRIHWIENSERQGIALNTNRAIAGASGDYIAFMDHDDELSAEALFHVVNRLQEHRYRFVYTDEDRIEEDESGLAFHHTPFFKPDFDPDLLLSVNYICHFVVMLRDAVTATGGLRAGLEGAQDHDFLLRATQGIAHSDILHLPRILYHWRVTHGSVSGTPGFTDKLQGNIVSLVNDHLRRTASPATAEAHSDPVGSARQFAARVRWSFASKAPRLSVLIATRDRADLMRPCIESVVDSLQQYPGDSEIVIVDNDSEDPSTLDYFAQLAGAGKASVVRFRGPFNWSAINNAAAKAATGQVLVFLNNDTVVLTKDWCSELAAHAMRQDVGAVGARLLYGDGTIQHAGVLIGIEGVAGHECVGDPPRDGGYFGRSHLLRSAAAVTGACLATRKEVFERIGGFDELELKVAFNDVDYCMKLRKAGYRVVYNPYAVLYHLESKSRGREVSGAKAARHHAEAMAFRARWKESEMSDPYYNPHFERYARPFDRLRPPPEFAPVLEASNLAGL